MFAYGTYLFYKSKVQRNDLDGAAKPIILSVHFGINDRNSFWDGKEAVFGDGYSRVDDVVAHELTHGVTQVYIQPVLLLSVGSHQRVAPTSIRRAL